MESGHPGKVLVDSVLILEYTIYTVPKIQAAGLETSQKVSGFLLELCYIP